MAAGTRVDGTKEGIFFLLFLLLVAGLWELIEIRGFLVLPSALCGSAAFRESGDATLPLSRLFGQAVVVPAGLVSANNCCCLSALKHSFRA